MLGRMVVLGALCVSGCVHGAQLCVDAHKTGCYATIGAAVAGAASGDVIEVAAGVYREYIEISKPVSLVSENAGNAIIDATGLPHAIFINGLGRDLSGVVVRGFTLRNANYEGLLIANASNVRVEDNRVAGNDQLLDPVNLKCPGLTDLHDFETAEDFDCGEAIHLTGVSNSMFRRNVVENNAGGILISDETCPTFNNVISENVVRNNPYDCGITIPSHPPAPSIRAFPPFGIYSNQILNNDVYNNGVKGEGAGVGIFGFMPMARVSENEIRGNRLINNRLPGVAMHGHSGMEILNNNVIIGNYIAGNGEDEDDTATPGPTGINVQSAGAISGTVIRDNVFRNEAIDIAVRSTAAVMAHNNNLSGPGAGVNNLGTGLVDASNNWWGCAQGPNTPACSSVTAGVVFTPWLTSVAVPNGAGLIK
jgi:hypothetical protein